MNHFIGIDAGASKSRLVIADELKKIIYSTTGKSANLHVQGTDKASAALASLIRDSVNESGVDLKSIAYIVIGAAGAGRRPDAERLEKTVCKKLKVKCGNEIKLKVISDADIALEGAFKGGPGCILISGTGSIAFGKDSKGDIIRTGGFGRLIGDEGSGYSIGQKGLNELSKQLDGRSPESVLSKLFRDELQIHSSADLINKVYSGGFEIPKAAPIVIKAASMNDPAGKKILSEEVLELLNYISAVQKKAGADKMKLAVAGSILTTDNYFSNLFKEMLTLHHKDIRLVKAAHPPEMGAVLMAIKLHRRDK